MKKILALLCCVLLLLSLCIGCGKNQNNQNLTPDDSNSQAVEPDQPASEQPNPAEDGTEEPVTPEEPEDPGDSAPEQEPEEAPAPEDPAAVITNQDCFDAAYCFRPEESGVYSFTAVTDEAFDGWETDYHQGIIMWTVYALEEEFDDAWRYLGQAAEPLISDLSGSIRVELEEGCYVYCVCSYNSLTSSEPAADNSGVLTIAPTSVPLLPAPENGYVTPVSIGTTIKADLDGDGAEETIFYDASPAYYEEDEDGSELWNDAKPLTLLVNGTEFLDGQGGNPFEPYGFWLENPDLTNYYLVDLDRNDGKLELAICDWGSNDATMTCLFRYENGALTYLGAISSTPDSERTTYHGDGTVSAYARFDVMQTWGGIVNYELKDGKMQRVQGEMVEPIVYDGWNILLSVPLTVYTAPDRTADTLTLEPSDQPLSFPLTDTEHWVKIVCADGSEGWAYFEEFAQVENNGTLVYDSEVFSNLIFAG